MYWISLTSMTTYGTVQEGLHDVFAEIGVLETVDELAQLRRASTKPNVGT